jgi:hypothetical protein
MQALVILDKQRWLPELHHLSPSSCADAKNAKLDIPEAVPQYMSPGATECSSRKHGPATTTAGEKKNISSQSEKFLHP